MRARVEDVGLLSLVALAAIGTACADRNPSMNANVGFEVRGFWGVSATDVFAVGEGASIPCDQSANQTIAHFDGHSWSVGSAMAAVAAPPGTRIMTDVTGTSATDVWAIGAACESGASESTAAIFHFDGTAWSRVHAEATASASAYRAIAAVAAGDVWVVGESGLDGPVASPIVRHWDGAGWTAVTVGGGSSSLIDVCANGADDVWVLGRTNDYPQNTSTVYRFDGAAWSSSPGPANAEVLSCHAGAVWLAAGRDVFQFVDGGFRQLGGELPSGGQIDALWIGAPADIWTVLYPDPESCPLNGEGPIFCTRRGDVQIVHWNGAEWSGIHLDPDHYGPYLAIWSAGGPSDPVWLGGGPTIDRLDPSSWR